MRRIKGLKEVKEEKKGWRRRMSKTRRSSRQRGCRGRKGMNEKRCEEGERKYTSGCLALLPHLLLLHPLLLLLLLEREWLSGCDEKIMRQIRPVSYYLHSSSRIGHNMIRTCGNQGQRIEGRNEKI